MFPFFLLLGVGRLQNGSLSSSILAQNMLENELVAKQYSNF